MKFYHFSLLFCILFLVFITVGDINFASQSKEKGEEQFLDQALSSSIDAAVNQLVSDEYHTIIHTAPTAIQTFFRTAYVWMNIEFDTLKQQQFNLYVPCIVIVDYDGIYLYYWTNSEDGLQMIQSNKIEYIFEEEGISYTFTLSKTYKKTDLKKKLTQTIQMNSKELELLQAECITSTIENAVERTMKEHNRIANQFGITYQFSFPVWKDSVFQNVIHTPTILLFFQGYPVCQGKETYEKYACCGAERVKKAGYFIMKEQSILYYHKPGCHHLDTDNPCEYAVDQKHCALLGAYPCPDCMGVK